VANRRSKRYRKDAEKIDRSKQYELGEAIELLKSLSKAGFDEAVEISMKLGIDTKQSDQVVRGSVGLPKGIGRDVKVIAFAEGEQAEAAKAAGADAVGGEDLVKRVEGGWTDFDVAVAHPSMMRLVGKLGRILGPQGKMPSPKSGTVVQDVGAAVKEFKAGKVEYRADAGGNVHCVVGRLSFDNADLKENIEAFIAHIKNVRPAAVKGTYVQNVVISSTMSPGIRIAV